MNDIEKFSALIDSSGAICLVTHTHPDGDAIGSTGAFHHFLRICRGKNAPVILPDTLSESLRFAAPDGAVIEADKKAAEAAEVILSADLVICLDFNAVSRSASLAEALRASGGRKVLIDHHLNPDREFFDIVFSCCDTSSSCELLYSILMRMPDIAGDILRLPLEAASSLMVGMTTDTNNFANSVYPSTLSMASELLRRGVDRDAIISHIYNEYRENRVRAISYLLDNRLVINGSVAYVIIDSATKKRFDLREGETEGLVNIPLGIGDVKISLLLTQDDGYFRVSIRSKKGYSANRLAVGFFNGGGHECASGGRLYFPRDIAVPEDAAAYVEEKTSLFMMEK